ncbi:MAG TPA: hypothetical protein VEK08_01840 [Planctomycetota bacterium]|nr:hypothetical protein [Planctomycetota bacterium]
MKRTVVFLAGFMSCMLLGVAFLLPSGGNKRRTLEPLTTATPAGKQSSKLPADAIVLTIADGAEVSAPLVVREDASAAGGVSLALPAGGRTKERKGRAVLNLTIPKDGTWQAWARVRWKDSCGNSISLKVADGDERMVGEDNLFGCWHWVEAGKHKLSAGKTTVTVIEREDNTALDQLLFTTEPAYQPVGAISPAGEARGVRRFADDFSRSPGHGMEAWDLVSGDWKINFSFDPNRIPNQYALVCDPPPAGKPATALIKGHTWYGARASFTFFPEKPGQYGMLLDRRAEDALKIVFDVAEGKSSIALSGPGVSQTVEAKAAVRLKQWHKVVVERWAWVTHVFVDDVLIAKNYSATPRAGQIGFFVDSGTAVFDDVEVEEIAWQADDGNELSIPWVISEGGEWFRANEPINKEAPAASARVSKTLIGHKGTIATRMGDLPLEEIYCEQDVVNGIGEADLAVDGLKLVPGITFFKSDPEVAAGGIVEKHLRRPDDLPPGAILTPLRREAGNVTIKVAGKETRIKRIAFRYGERTPKKYVIGPYHFSEAYIPDPSDYLDFTPEEYKKMASLPEADKLARRAKFRPLVGDWGDELSPWIRERGGWRVNDGVLMSNGPAIVRMAEEMSDDLELRMRLRLLDPRASAEIELYAIPDPGIRILIAGAKSAQAPQGAAKPSRPAAARLEVPEDNNWHDVVVRVTGNTLTAALDKDAQKDISVTRGDGARLMLKNFYGRIDFDDIELTLPKRSESSSRYVFSNRETEWWRETDADPASQWMDHAGISCVLASSWVSLLAQKGEGLLWNKRSFGPDTSVAFDIEENTEWFGWDHAHSHEHHTFDNVSVVLAKEIPAAPLKRDAEGYRLEVNADNRSASILYRNGKEVARVAQDHTFPIRYVGGHAPYFPRVNRIWLVKRGPLVRVMVNGKEVLRYTDPEPVDVKRVAIGGYNTRINFSHIEVRSLPPAEAAQPAETLSSSEKPAPATPAAPK